MNWLRASLCVVSLASLPAASLSAAQQPVAASEQLAGLWKAKKRFGPDERGFLAIEKIGDEFVADFMGKRVRISQSNGELSFAMPGELGRFAGRFDGSSTILGHWMASPTAVSFGSEAFPVVLRSSGSGKWVGTVAPAPDNFTFYLLLKTGAGGSLPAVLGNPEFDYGTQRGVDHLEVQGTALTLVGTRAGKSVPVASGTYNPDERLITLTFDRGGVYEFVPDTGDSDFYPRGRDPQPYSYRPPLSRDDGWTVSTLRQENISRAALERSTQRLIDQPMDSGARLQIHGLLIARHGKLVFEEYFHGENRDKLHTLRSASKSLTSVIIGAGIQAGAPLALSSPVYKIMNGGAFPDGLEARKKEMTLEHLLTMSSGYFCDDTNDEAPGNEETMINQTAKPDYYRYTLDVPLITQPGANSVYCSASPNLALGMLGRATGESPLYAFDKFVARPLQIRDYSWPLDPAGNPYGGGSVSLLPRDFLKLGQLMLNNGRWNGRQILSTAFAKRSTSPLYHLRNITYGYLWWVEDLPYKNRTVRAFAAFGAGGQSLTVVPELDLVVATLGGSFSNATQKDITVNLVPRIVLPAVREPGDPIDPAESERQFSTPYGPSKDGSPVTAPARPPGGGSGQ